jgi:Asp-tRNA(Asn)/Glu-tRNA(Gln) amidotransferase A subunit family amidase
VALALSVMAGHDPQDPTSAEHPVGDLRVDGGGAPLRIGFLRTWTEASAAPTVAALVAAALEELAAAGADVVELDVDGVGAASGMFADLVLAEAAAVHAQRLAETPDGFAPDARSRLEHGAAVTGPAYAVARHRARAWTSRVREAMRDVDLLACPTTPVVAPRLDDIDQLEGTVLMGRFTVAWVLTGQPSASVPCGFDGGLPAGLQLIGRPWEEATVLRAAAAYQSRTGWHLARPPEPAGV